MVFWIGVAVTVLGLFMLVAGIGPLWLPILVIVVGVAIAVRERLASRRSQSS